MGNNITIKDVAHRAGVSISTVSRTLNNSANVDDKLKSRVIEAVEALGYSPNDIARSLKRNNSSLIAYVVSNTSDPFFTVISRGMEESLFDHGYSLISCSTNFSIDRERTFLRTLNERRVDGIVINTVGNNDNVISQISNSIPVILSNRSVGASGFRGDFVDFDNVAGMMELTNHLLELGHRRIAILNGPNYLSTASERFSGFGDAMMMAGVDIKNNYPYIYRDADRFSFEEGYKAAMDFMGMDVPPTAMIAANSEMALGAIRYCRQNGVRIPEDVSMCCYGNILHNDLMFTMITHEKMDLFAFGKRIASLLLERIQSDSVSMNREIRFSTSFVPGDSTAPPKG